MCRLATVRSGPRQEPFLETVKKTGPYGLVNWDRSPDQKIRSGLELEMETDKKTGPYSPALWDRSPVRSFNRSDQTVQSGLRPNRLVGFTFLGDLEHISVTPMRYS